MPKKGFRMESDQYEELCRCFIAEKEGLSIDKVVSTRIANPTRSGLPEYKHQIDLYWETGTEISAYINIANAKWRATEKIDQGDVLLLQQVRQKIAAHKAIIITNTGFTAGAVAAAKDEGIALHVLVPSLDVSQLPKGDRATIQIRLSELMMQSREPIWSHRVELRGLGFARDNIASSATGRGYETIKNPTYETKVIQTSTQRTATPPANKSVGRTETRGGFGGNKGGDFGGSMKK